MGRANRFGSPFFVNQMIRREKILALVTFATSDRNRITHLGNLGEGLPIQVELGDLVRMLSQSRG